MKNCKQIMTAAAALLMLTALAGCQNVESSSAAPAANTTAAAETTAASNQAGGSEVSAPASTAGAPNFVPTINGITAAIDSDCDAVIAQLGTPVSTFDAPSCAFTGTSYTYTYDGFIVETYPMDNKNLVFSVTINSDKVKTAEGLTVGSTAADVKAACGEPAKDLATLIVYSNDTVDFQFFLNDDETVKTIVYTRHVG